MQSQTNPTNIIGGGHKRRPSLGKEMPISTLLFDFQPPSSNNYDFLSRDGLSPSDFKTTSSSSSSSEKPPMFFHLNEINEDEQQRELMIKFKQQQPPPNTPTNLSESRHNFMMNMIKTDESDADDSEQEQDGTQSDGCDDGYNDEQSSSSSDDNNDVHPLDDDETRNLQENFNPIDFRKKLEIAETLAKTSMLMSPAVKRRLAARKVEMDLENSTSEPFYDEDGNDYVPPRELLIYLVR